MGIMLALDLFQSQMVHLFSEANNQQPFLYMDNIFHFKGLTFKEHILILNKILQLIGINGMQVSADKSQFCQE
jgi:hypothetical protein